MEKRLIAVLAILGVFIAGILVYNGVQKTIIVEDRGVKKVYKTFAGNVEEFLKTNKIQIAAEDGLNIGLQTKLQEDMQLVIDRAVTVHLSIDDETKDIKTCAKTVKDVLIGENIQLGKKDALKNVKLDTPVKEGLQVEVAKYREEIIKEKNKIPFSLEKKNTNDLGRGKVRVVQEGKEGIEESTLKVSYLGTKEVGRQEVHKKVLQQPVKRVEEIGTAIVVVTSRGELRANKMYNMKVTGYTASYADTGKRPGDRGFGVTASGMRVRVGVVAVDPRVIPLGTRLYVEGYGNCIAGDTGSAIKGQRVDLYFNSTREARNFGVQTKKVYVLE